MAVTTIGVYLGYADKPASADIATEYTKLADLISFSELESEPSLIDISTMSNKAYVYKRGLKNQPLQNYTVLYDPVLYATIKEMENDVKAFCLLFDDDHSLLYWVGSASVQIGDGEIDDKVTMTISIAAETELNLDYTKATTITPTKWYYHETGQKINKTA